MRYRWRCRTCEKTGEVSSLLVVSPYSVLDQRLLESVRSSHAAISPLCSKMHGNVTELPFVFDEAQEEIRGFGEAE